MGTPLPHGYTPLTPPYGLRPSKSFSDFSALETSPSRSIVPNNKMTPIASRAIHSSIGSGDYPSFLSSTLVAGNGSQGSLLPTPDVTLRNASPSFRNGRRNSPPDLKIVPPVIHLTSTRTERHDSRVSSPDTSSSRASQFSLPALEESYMLRPPVSAPPNAHQGPFFYQQEQGSMRVRSAPDFFGPTLEDYYGGSLGFNPPATSTPEQERRSFSLGPPGHPSSIPVPFPSRPLLFPEDAVSDAGSDEPIPAVSQKKKRKGPSFSSLRKWLPRSRSNSGTNVDLEREADSVSKRASSVFRSSFDRSTTSSRMSNSRSSGSLSSTTDVFSSSRSQPSFYPSSPPLMSRTFSFSTSASLPSVYASPPPPRVVLSPITVDSDEENVYLPEPESPTLTIRRPPSIASTTSSNSIYLTPSTPTPPPRHARTRSRGLLTQRVNVLSVIEASPNSTAAHSNSGLATAERTPLREVHVPTSVTDTTSTSSPLTEDDTDGSPLAKKSDPRRRTILRASVDSSSTNANRRSARSSMQSLFRRSKSVVVSPAVGEAGPSTTMVGVASTASRRRSKQEIADEEFESRSDTPTSFEMRQLRNRRHWDSRDLDNESVLTDVVSPDKGKGVARAPPPRPSRPDSVSLSSRRELVLPQLVQARSSIDSTSRHRASGSGINSPPLMTPSPSPHRAYMSFAPQRRVRIVSPNVSPMVSTSPTFEHQQQHRPLLLSPTPGYEHGRKGPINSSYGLLSPTSPSPQNMTHSTPTSIPASSPYYDEAPTIFTIAVDIVRHPLWALDMFLPAQVLFLLGFVLGPWTWLIGGWMLSPDGHVHSVDREGAVVFPSRFAKKRRSIGSMGSSSRISGGASASASVDLNGHAHAHESGWKRSSASSRKGSVSETLNTARSSYALLGRPGSTGGLRHHRHQQNQDEGKGMTVHLRDARTGSPLLHRWMGVLPLSSDSPSPWVWKCRVAAIGSGTVILVLVVLSLIVAIRHHL